MIWKSFKALLSSRLAGAVPVGQVLSLLGGRIEAWVLSPSADKNIVLRCSVNGRQVLDKKIVIAELAPTESNQPVQVTISLPESLRLSIDDQVAVTFAAYDTQLAGSPWTIRESAPKVPFALLHIPKTAGTSLRVALEAALGPNAVLPSADYLKRRGGKYLSGKDLGKAYMGASDGLKLIQGHFSFKELQRLAPEAAVMTVLREPVARVVSLLKHHKARHGIQMAYQDMITLGGPAFNAASNHQVKLLSTLPEGADVSEHLESAMATLNKCAAVGVTERYSETLKLCSHLVGEPLGPPQTLNRSDLQLEALPDEFLEDLAFRNRSDTILYRHALKILDSSAAQLLLEVD